MSSPNYLLIVEDEPELLEILENLCKEVARNIKVARHGNEALEIFRTFKVDTILSDITMPEMSGLELLSQIRLMGSKVPFIVVTGYGDNANSSQAFLLGATSLINKPFDDDALLRIVKTSLIAGFKIRQTLE